MMERIYNPAYIQTHSVDDHTFCILKSCLDHSGADAASLNYARWQ